MPKTLIVIGGGAAGFFCAVNAVRMDRQLKVIILERSSKILSKVKVSGGGRCNVTHACFDIEEMIKNYPRGKHFVKKAFHRFFTNETIAWFKERGVVLKVEDDGRMFPTTDSSETIIECLIKEANKYGVEILMNRQVEKIERINGQWSLATSGSRLLTSDFLCIASGGYPKSSMFDWLKNTGHSIEEPVPSLFTFNLPDDPITKLMGISVAHARLKINGTKLTEQGPVLITHWGLSGPAVLRLSAWGARELATNGYQFTVSINWLPEFNAESIREKFRELRIENASKKIDSKNPFGLPQRLWEFIIYQSGITENMRWADMPTQLQNTVMQNLVSAQFEVKGKTTFKEEFVTAGGIKLSEIDADTMQSKIAPGLFFAGEVINVDGITGGFNFQHAWTSGYIAAETIAKDSHRFTD